MRQQDELFAGHDQPLRHSDDATALRLQVALARQVEIQFRGKPDACHPKSGTQAVQSRRQILGGPEETAGVEMIMIAADGQHRHAARFYPAP